jgi:hypothetical protein
MSWRNVVSEISFALEEPTANCMNSQRATRIRRT